MKVLILATGYPRWRGDFSNVYLHRLAKSLIKVGVEVHVVAPHADGLKKEEVIDGIHIHRFQYMFPDRLEMLAYFPGMPEKIKTIQGKILLPFFMSSMIKKMLDVVKNYNIDIINAHWAIPPGFLAAFTKSLHKKPVLITLYGAELWPAIKNDSKVMKWMISYALNNADKVVGISDATCDAGKEISGREDIEILPDGIDTETFNPEVDGSKVRERYNLENHFMIFSSGRMVERKGFRYLIEALHYVLENNPNTKLIIGGDGPEKNTLEELTKSLKIETNVIFPGFISDEDFPKYMKASDVFVLPSIVDSKGDTEGSATILLEAMACGTPVVGTKVGGVPYAIKDGIGGYLVEQKNPEQMANKILVLLENEELRKKLGQIGRKYMEDKFSWDKIAKKYIEEFTNVNKNQSVNHKIYWEKRAAELDDISGVGRKGLPVGLNKLRIHLTEKIIKDNIDLTNKRILDAGCGTGIYLSFFKDYSSHAIGVDISNKYVNFCKENSLNAIPSSLESLPFKDKNFDVVFCNASLQHITDLKKREIALSELIRVTNDRGMIIIGEENKTIFHKIKKEPSYIKYLDYTAYLNLFHNIRHVKLKRVIYDTTTTSLVVSYKLIKNEKFSEIFSRFMKKMIPRSLAFRVYFILERN